MNKRRLCKLIEAIEHRDNRRWATPSGQFLDELRDLAQEGEIPVISTACYAYFSRYPITRHFVSAALPAILVNRYKPLTSGVSFRTFLAWVRMNPGWWSAIRDNAASPNLQAVLADMVASVQLYALKTRFA